VIYLALVPWFRCSSTLRKGTILLELAQLFSQCPMSKNNYRSPPSPRSSSSNGSSSKSKDASSEIDLGSLVLAGVGALIGSSTLWLAFKQVVTSKAQLHQSTLAAARETTAGMLRETGQGIGSRAWVTFQGTYRVGGAISTGGSVAFSTVGTRASSLINETQRHLSEASV
jgi:hypothetical protein